jgi:hypothetical protein
VTCEECRDLNTHQFRSPDDMVHAIQVAAVESERGVLKRLEVPRDTARIRNDDPSDSNAVREALASVYASDLPEQVHYRFECTTCGDRFDLRADIAAGQGNWVREAKAG